MSEMAGKVNQRARLPSSYLTSQKKPKARFPAYSFLAM